jgi:cell division protein FtsI (penicillin-binding protein 3)/stage V sporulation protein D (sporulation-specific penicillin-binding protein)
MANLTDNGSGTRLAAMAGAVVAVYLGLAAWVAVFQVWEHEHWGKLATDNLRRRTLRPARRGAVLDQRGVMLATSVPTKTVCADPSMIFTQHVMVARTLAPLLEIPEPELLKQLLPKVRRNTNGVFVTNSYVVLKTDMPIGRWQLVTQAMSRLDVHLPEPGKRMTSGLKLALGALRTKAIFGVDDHRRQYPAGALAAQVLGYVESGDLVTEHGRVFEDHGVGGIELTFDDMLTGVHGWQTPFEDVAPRDGLNVVLTLDANVQHMVEDELIKAFGKYRPASVCCVVVRPGTGEILALASLPNFDPGAPAGQGVGQLNHAISDIYEPGSTFKIVTITTALDARLLTLEETVFCENGRWLYGGKYLHDHHPYGVLPFETVVAKSSNIGTAKAALRLGPGRLYHTVTNFGFGQLTTIPLPGELTGVVRATNRWNKLSITRVPIGHEVSATPLQMAMAMAAVANGGVLMQPRLVDRLEDADGRVVRLFPTNALRRVAGVEACREMKRALRRAASEEGTASAARLEYYTVAGKTGTAEKFVKGENGKGGTYKSGKYYASFIGFLPVEQPELCILVGMDEPDKRVGHMGGGVAAPVFKAIAERVANYLRLPPDLVPEVEPESGPGLRPRGEPQPELVNRRALVRAGEGLPGGRR